jgi:hypothetical protein
MHRLGSDEKMKVTTKLAATVFPVYLKITVPTTIFENQINLKKNSSSGL